LPGDTGTLSEEIATLGAEYYMNHEENGTSDLGQGLDSDLEPPGLRALVSSAAGVMGMAVTVLDLPAHKIQLQSIREPRLSDEIERIFGAVATSAYRQLVEVLREKRGWEDVLAQFELNEPMVALMRRGYRLCRHRFPDQALARQRFQAASIRLHELAGTVEEGALLVARREGYDLSFQFEP
jgi:hypothetical protein